MSACSKQREDVIGQQSWRRSTACFQCALNYASLSFHQPHTGRQIKDASAEAPVVRVGKINLQLEDLSPEALLKLTPDAE